MMRLSAVKEYGEEGGISKYSRKGVCSRVPDQHKSSG